jgi:glycosyltransferase involved in cell wall biosynthesis
MLVVERNQAKLVLPHRRPRSAMPLVFDTRVVAGSGGGPDKTILNQPRFLAPAGYRNVVGYLHPPGDPGFDVIRQKAAARTAEIVSIPDRGPLDWSVVPKLLNYCRRERVAIWHGHDYKSNALGLLLRWFWPMRLVTTVHGWVHHTERTPIYYWIDRACLPYYEKVICVSEDLRQRCLECGVPAERCIVIENGIDLDEYRRRHDVTAAKCRLGLDPNRLLVGAVGRLSKEKGFDLLIRAADRLLRDGLDLQLVIIGEGDQRGPLQTLIDELGQQDRIRLAGYHSDLAGWYEAMDVYALSSLREGLPNVLLEAMALEVPVVATRIAGVPRLVRDGENGLLIEPGSLDELTAALGRFLREPSLRERYRTAGRRTVETDYSFAVRMDKVRAIYDELLNRDGN